MKMKHEQNKIYEIELSCVYADSLFNSRGTFNPETCRGLAKDIDEHGLLQPIILRERREDELNFKPDRPYALVAGFRRYEAFKILKRGSIPAIFRDVSEKEAFAINVAENLERVDISLENEINIVLNMLEKGFTKSEIRATLNKGQKWISDRLSLSQLPKVIKAKLFSGEIPITLALDLAKEQDPNIQKITLDRLLEFERARLERLKNNFSRKGKRSAETKLSRLRGSADLLKIENYIAGKMGTNNMLSDLIRFIRRDISYEGLFDIFQKRYPALNWIDYLEDFKKELKK